MRSSLVSLLIAFFVGLILGPARGQELATHQQQPPVLLLHLDEVEGELRDTSGEDNAVSAEGTTRSKPGRFGKALWFDGKSDYVRVDGLTFCFPSQTIELWVRPAAQSAKVGLISSQASPGPAQWRWYLARNEDGTVSFHLWDNSPDFKTNPDREARGAAKIVDDEWTHLAVTIDTAAAKQAALYVNGKREAVVQVLDNNPFGSLFIGTSVFAEFFGGEIDEVAIFDKALSEEEISRHAASSTAFPNGASVAPNWIVMKPVDDTAWFTFKHHLLGRSRWTFRMPEYMYKDEQTNTYQPPSGVVWDRQPDGRKLSLRCGLPETRKKELCLDFWGTITAGEDMVDFELTVKNVGPETWRSERMVLFCLQSKGVPMFFDYEAQRTFVRKGDRWITMNEIVSGKFESHRMCGVAVQQGGPAGAERLAAKVSKDGKFVLGLATDIAASLSFNFQEVASCIHSNPSWGLLKPGEQKTAKGRIYLFAGTLEDLWKRYASDFRRHG